MKTNCVTWHIMQFNATKNPIYMARALRVLLSQGRIHELLYGWYCGLFLRPSKSDGGPNPALRTMLADCLPWLSSKDFLTREELINVYGAEFAVHALPADFTRARRETIVRDENCLILGEYGDSEKRIACVTRTACSINDHYEANPRVRHIHALFKAESSTDVLVTTGDTAKLLDLWTLDGGELVFQRRIRSHLAGHTAITRVGNTYYLGTDFSNRPNYIETLDGDRYGFPEKAYRMHVLGFRPYLGRYVLSKNRMQGIGTLRALSVFDTFTRRFVYCDYLDVPVTSEPRIQPGYAA